jgi:hypothetical protein
MITGQGKSWSEVADALTNIPGSDDAELTQIRSDFEQNMKLFGGDAEEYEAGRNYENLPTFLLTRIGTLNKQLADLRRSESDLTQQKAALETAANERVKKAEADRDAARADLASERDKFSKDLADVRQQMQAIVTQSNEKDARIVELNTQVEDQQKQLNKRIEDLAKTVDDMRNQLRQQRQTWFEAPDAIVTEADQRAGVVYINVGSDDLLRVQQTFSVFDKGTTGIMDVQPKGRIEVREILGSHLARCEILEDQVGNIIMPGDLVFTPVWTAGAPVHFAITGFIDMTGSGQNEADLLRRLLELNGGVVDDTVTVQTRYLVQGENRGETPDGEPTQEDKDDFQAKLNAAVEIGVDRVSVDKLLALMGWKADVTTVTLGSGSSSAAAAEAGAGEGQESPFRKRTPPRGDSGAF